MDSHTLAPRDIADDFLSANGIAAFGPIDEQIVESSNLQLGIAANSQDALDDGCELRLFFLRGFLQAIGRETRDDLLCGYFSVTDSGKKILDLARSIL